MAEEDHLGLAMEYHLAARVNDGGASRAIDNDAGRVIENDAGRATDNDAGRTNDNDAGRANDNDAVTIGKDPVIGYSRFGGRDIGNVWRFEIQIHSGKGCEDVEWKEFGSFGEPFSSDDEGKAFGHVAANNRDKSLGLVETGERFRAVDVKAAGSLDRGCILGDELGRGRLVVELGAGRACYQEAGQRFRAVDVEAAGSLDRGCILVDELGRGRLVVDLRAGWACYQETGQRFRAVEIELVVSLDHDCILAHELGRGGVPCLIVGLFLSHTGAAEDGLCLFEAGRRVSSPS